MYKNMIRKGAAIASGLALAGTGFVAAPAQATATGLLWSPQGQVDELIGVGGDNFKLQFANPSSASTLFDTDASTTNDLTTDKVTVNWVPVGGKTAPTITKSVDETSGFAFGAEASNELKVVVGVDDEAVTSTVSSIPDGVIALTGPSGLDYDAQFTVMVTYNDGSTSEVETVTFREETSVTAALSVNPVTQGASKTVSGTFALNGINTENWVENNADAIQATSDSNDVGLILTNNTTPLTGGSTSYSALNDTYTISQTGVTVAESTSVSMAATFNSVEINKHFDSSKTTADAASAEFSVQAIDTTAALELAVSNTTAVYNDTATDTSFVPGNTVYAPEGTNSLNFVVSALTGDPATAAGKDLPITVTLSDNVSPSNGLGTTTITSNGQSLDVSGDSISFTVLTNSAGKAAFTVEADNAVGGESFHIDVANSLDDSITQTLVEWQEPVMTALPAVDGDFTIAPGDSLSLDYTVIDQFGNTADSDYQLVFTREEESGDRDSSAEYANWSYVAPVSADGTASVTIVDNGAADVEGVDTVTATVQQKAGSGSGFVAASGATNDTFRLTYDNDLADMELTAEASYDGIENSDGDVIHPLKIETKTLENFDSRIGGEKPEYNTDGQAGQGNVPNVTIDTDYAVGADVANVVGTVNTSGGDPVEGVAVRLSADGMNFSDEETLAAATILSNDSITVFTDATGSYEAFFRSGNAGDQTITVDAQGTTDSVEVRFQNSTGVAEGLNLDISNPVINPGARADIVATIVDAQGQPVPGVTVNFKDNGPGVLNASTAVTDIFGEAQVTLSTTEEESGQTEITAYATIGGVNVVQRATVTVGSGAAGGGYPAVAPLNAWTVNQDGTAKVYVKFPTIGEKVRIGHQTGGSGSYETIFVKTLDSETDSALTVNAEGSYIVRTIDLVDGTNRIRVTVGDSTEVQVRYNE